MVVFLRLQVVVLAIGALVIERCHTLQPLVQCGQIAGIAAIGVGPLQVWIVACGLLAEQVATALHPMVQRNSLHRQRTVFIDNLLLRRIHLPEVHFVIHIATEHIHLPARHVY